MKKKKFLIHPSTHPPSIHSSIHPSIHPSINHGTLVGASERLGDGMKRGKCPTTVTGKGQNKFGWVREEQLSWFCHLCGVLSLPKKRKSLVLTYWLCSFTCLKKPVPLKPCIKYNLDSSTNFYWAFFWPTKAKDINFVFKIHYRLQ